jgi:ribonuclease P protein component
MRRQLRLRRRGDFARLRQVGQSSHHAWFILSRTANMLAHNRYGVIVSKRVGKAVRRNRLRRQMREVMRLLHPSLSQGFDIVLIARTALVGQSFQAISQAVATTCQHVGLLTKE